MELKFKTPSVPNFVTIDLGKVGSRQDGFQHAPTVRVGELTDEQLEELARKWRDALFKVAEYQRINLYLDLGRK